MIAQVGRAGDAAHALQVCAERLDHDVLLAEHIVHSLENEGKQAQDD